MSKLTRVARNVRAFAIGALAAALLAAPVLLAKQYHNTDGTISTGAVGEALDGSATILPIASTAAESNHVMKASAGTLYAFQAATGASSGFVMFFDATVAPGDGAVTPALCYGIAATSQVSQSWTVGPAVAFASGITMVFSTGATCFSKTASATAYFSALVR